MSVRIENAGPVWSSLRGALPVWASLAAMGAIAWVVTVAQAREMGAGPGTMGLAFPLFAAMWVAMMAAMMLPAIGPVAAGVGRPGSRAATRVGSGLFFGAGFLLPWAAYGVLAFVALSGTGQLVEAWPDAARWLGVGILAVAGLYQFSPWKLRALAHCRMVAHRDHRSSASLGDGIRDGVVCVGCCWALMTVLIAMGVMNLAAMAGLAAAIFAEKVLPRPRLIAGLVGVALLALAVTAALDPGILSGLMPAPMEMEPMEPSMGGM